jgi:hypothetical protein
MARSTALSNDAASRAALGFRSHSGWAMLVAVGGAAGAPSVLLRRRIELAGPRTPRQPFHAAEGRPLKEAEALIRRSTSEARELAGRGVEQAVAELGKAGARIVGCSLLLASGRRLPALAEILASHALIHAAEGELFREALREAARGCGLPLAEVKERELPDQAARSLGITPAEQKRLLDEWRRVLGPPWRQDEKLAALAAWLALAR